MLINIIPTQPDQEAVVVLLHEVGSDDNGLFVVKLFIQYVRWAEAHINPLMKDLKTGEEHSFEKESTAGYHSAV